MIKVQVSPGARKMMDGFEERTTSDRTKSQGENR